MDWSYVAGLFDRSGNINKIKVKGREYIQLRFYNSHKGILEEIQHFMGCGRIYVKKLSKRNTKWRDRFELTITTKKDIFTVLSEMLPFLVVKQDRVYDILTNNVLFKGLLGELKEDVVAKGIEDAEGEEEEEKKEDVPYIG